MASRIQGWVKSLHFLSLFYSGSGNVCMLVVSTWASNVCCYDEPRKPSTLLLLVCQRLHLRQTCSPRCHAFALKLPFQIWITPPDNHRARTWMHLETTIQPFLQGPVEKKEKQNPGAGSTTTLPGSYHAAFLP